MNEGLHQWLLDRDLGKVLIWQESVLRFTWHLSFHLELYWERRDTCTPLMRTSSSSTHNISVRALRRIRDFYIFNGDVIHQESTFDTTMKSLHATQRHLCGLCLLFTIKFSSILSSFLHWIGVRHRSPLRKPIRAIEFYFYCLKKSSHACAGHLRATDTAARDGNPGEKP